MSGREGLPVLAYLLFGSGLDLVSHERPATLFRY